MQFVIYRPVFVTLTVLTTLFLAACGDPPINGVQPSGGSGDAGSGDGGVPDLANSDACRPTLTPDGADVLTVPAGQTVELAAVYRDCTGAPVVGGLVSFTITGGEANGSRLSAGNANADQDGRASVNLSAGFAQARFFVSVEAPNAGSVQFDVVVQVGATGTVEVHMTYAGRHTLDRFTARLWDGRCTSVDRHTPLGEQGVSPSVNLVGAPAQITGVSPGSSYAVSVHAEFAGAMLAFGCVEPVVVEGARTARVDVALVDLRATYNGTWALENLFDLADALPPSISEPLHLFAEMGDDHDVEGDSVAREFGLDPAAFLLDFVFREMCCWEADAGNGYDACKAQATTHPVGDISALYLQDFRTWSRAEPQTQFLCGALDSSWGFMQTIQETVQSFIEARVPAPALRLLDIASDLAQAFTDMNISSTLTIVDMTDNKEGNFTHTLDTMTVELHDFDGLEHVFEFELSAAGLTNLSYEGVTSVDADDQLHIPSHSFDVDMGRLLLYVYQTLLIPLLDCGGSPCTSTGDLFASWLDCVAVGNWIEASFYGATGLPAFFDGQAMCRTGLNLAGSYVDGEISRSVGANAVMTLEGTAAAGSVSARMEAQSLVDGEWTGTLVEADYSGDFDGLFTGELDTGD